MKVVGLQLDIVWENKQANFYTVRRLLEAANVERGSLVVLPEMFATGYSMNVAAIAEGGSHEAETFLGELARRYGVYMLAGVVTTAQDGRGRNEAVVFNPDGSELARYCKLHPFSYADETKYYVPGERIVTFEWAEFTAAPLICYDLRFPEVFRRAIPEGATLFAVIANWPTARESHWLALLRARAIENQAYVVGVNRCGCDPNHSYCGRSLIVDPHGKILADAGNDEGAIAARVDLDALEQYRRKFPALRDIRSQ